MRGRYHLLLSVLLVGCWPLVTNAQISPITWAQCGQLGVACQNSIRDYIQTIVNVLLSLVAVVAVIMIIYGGIRYVLSAGEEEAAKTAKRVILYAVIGLIVIGLSAALVNFTINAIQQQPAAGPAP